MFQWTYVGLIEPVLLVQVRKAEDSKSPNGVGSGRPLQWRTAVTWPGSNLFPSHCQIPKKAPSIQILSQSPKLLTKSRWRCVCYTHALAISHSHHFGLSRFGRQRLVVKTRRLRSPAPCAHDAARTSDHEGRSPLRLLITTRVLRRPLLLLRLFGQGSA